MSKEIYLSEKFLMCLQSYAQSGHIFKMRRANSVSTINFTLMWYIKVLIDIL